MALLRFRTPGGVVFCSSIALGFLALGRAGFAVYHMDVAPRYVVIVMGSGVHLVCGIVKDVQPQKMILSDGTYIPYGLLVCTVYRGWPFTICELPGYSQSTWWKSNCSSKHMHLNGENWSLWKMGLETSGALASAQERLGMAPGQKDSLFKLKECTPEKKQNAFKDKSKYELVKLEVMWGEILRQRKFDSRVGQIFTEILWWSVLGVGLLALSLRSLPLMHIPQFTTRLVK
ncbi:Uncharacterized protein Fot_22055 [Forsythia ovata]|uniref:Uncharacterized protein n=1 Tax=Forsythia ovata TaxID=205694 RepID=A0ABD1UWL6_9LAMI